MTQLFLLLFSGLVWAETSPKVILISWDGFGANVAKVAKTPNLNRLKERGIFTLKAKTVVPSITLVSHTSMLTGLDPARHMVTWNNYKPEKGDIKSSVFSLLKAQGKKTAMIAGKDKFRHLAKDAGSFKILPKDSEVGGAAQELIKTGLPDFLFLHFPEIDGAGHTIGWLSEKQLAAAQSTDQILGGILDLIRDAGLESTTTIILSADHGGHLKNHGSDSNDDMLIPWIAAGRLVPQSGEIAKIVNTTDTAATVLWLLGVPPPKNLDGHSVLPL